MKSLKGVVPIDKEKIIAQAQKYFLKGQSKKAIKEYQKLIEGGPKDKRLYLKLGDVYLKEGESAKAIKEYLKVADLYAEDDLNLRAISIYKKVLSIDPKLLDALRKIADLYHKEGLEGSAKSYYEAILRMRPEDQSALDGLRRTETSSGNRGGQKFGESFQPFPSKPHEVMRPAQMEEEISFAPTQPEGLGETHGEADLVSPDKDSEMHYHLGIAYKEMELFDYAISEFETAAANQVIKFDCYIMLGDCYMEKGDHDRCIEYYRMASESQCLSNEKLARLHFNLGLAFEASGMASEAIEAFNQVLTLDQSMGEAQERIKKLQGLHPGRSVGKT